MRGMKYLLVVMVLFSLVLSACSSGGAQETQSAYPAGTETTGLGNSNTNTNLNGNTNANANGNANANANANTNGAAPTKATATAGGLATPLGTAMGTPAVTKAPVTAATTQAPAATKSPMTTTAPMTTGTPGAGAVTTAAVTQSAAGGAQTYENGILLSNLIGANIQNANGDNLGEVDSAILDQTNCTVPYLLVRVNPDSLGAAMNATPGAGGTNTNGNANANTNGVGGTNTNSNANANANTNTVAGTTTPQAPGMGGSQGPDGSGGDLALVPLSAFFSGGQRGVLTLPLTLDEKAIGLLAKAPKYTEDTLPSWAAPDWNAGLNTAWPGYTVATGGTTSATNTNGNANANSNAAGGTNANSNANVNANANAAGGAPMMRGTGAVRLNDVTDLNVTNAKGDDLGDIEDIAVSLNNEPATIFLAVGGILDLGEKLIPLPCDRVNFQMDDSGAVKVIVNADQNALKNAPTINELPAAFDPGWNTNYTSYWQTAP